MAQKAVRNSLSPNIVFVRQTMLSTRVSGLQSSQVAGNNPLFQYKVEGKGGVTRHPNKTKQDSHSGIQRFAVMKLEGLVHLRMLAKNKTNGVNLHLVQSYGANQVTKQKTQDKAKQVCCTMKPNAMKKTEPKYILRDSGRETLQHLQHQKVTK